MKYTFAACMAWGIVPFLSSFGYAQSAPVRAVPPIPTQFAAISHDDQVVPVAHFETVGDQGGPIARPADRRTTVGTLKTPPQRVMRASAQVPVPTPVPDPTSVLAAPGPMSAPPAMPSTAPTQSVAMQLSDDSGPWPAAGCADGGCADGACMAPLTECNGSCGGTCVSCCSDPVWKHRTGVFGEYLYLRPRAAEIVYAAPIDGPIVNAPNNPIQIGALGMIDPEYQSGYRAGFGIALNDCSSITVGYTRFDSSTSGTITTQPGDVLRSLVAHPSSTSAATDWLDASAQYDVDFQFADIAYSGLWRGGDRYAINYLIGARYGKLDQAFSSTFSANGSEVVTSNVNFEGGGIRLGLDAERYGCGKKLFLYSRGNASFLAGQFDASYFQGQSFDPTVADTSWSAGRIVTVLDLEAGLGWRSQCGRVKLSTGYLVSGWLNAVKANHFIESVRQNNFLSLSDTFTFDGFVVRGEFRF